MIRRPVRRAAEACLVVARLGTWVTAARAQQHSRFEDGARTITLDNGLEVIVVEDHVIPLATVLVAVRNGAFTQEPSAEGIAHLYEHMLFRTYDNDARAFWRAVGELEGAANGGTEAEVVYYYIQVPSERAKAAVEVLAHLVRDPRFTDADLTAERPIVLNELQRGQSDPEGALARSVRPRPVGPVLESEGRGRRQHVARPGLPVARLRDTWNRYYLPNNAAVIVTGDINATEILHEATKQFGSWRQGPNPFNTGEGVTIDPLRSRRAVVMGGAVRDVTILLEWQGPSVRSDAPATYAADALFAIFNAPTSPFQHRLVDFGLVPIGERQLPHPRSRRDPSSSGARRRPSGPRRR